MANNLSSHGRECSMQMLYCTVFVISIAISQSLFNHVNLLVPEESCSIPIVFPNFVIAD